jgi:hypothetical protein
MVTGPVRTFTSAVSLTGSRAPKFRAGVNGSDLIVDGCEVFRDISVSQYYAPLQFTINPSNILLFPKLQAIGSVFEEFAVRKLHFRYIPACPSTRSGSFTLSLDYDPNDPAPKSVLEAMANSSSVTFGAGDRAELRFDPVAQRLRWYYTNVPTNISVVPDNRQISPATLFVLSLNATSADSGSIGGYLTVDYEFEFRTMRPASEAFFAATAANTGLSIPSGGSTLDLLLQNALGYTGLTGSSLTVGNPGSYAVSEKNATLMSAGLYVLSTLWSWLGAATELDEEFKRPSIRRQVAFSERNEMLPGGKTSSYVEEKVVSPKSSLKSPRAKSPRLDASISYVSVKQDASGVWWGLLEDSSEWVKIPPSEPIPQASLTTGDVGLYLVSVDLATGVGTTIDTYAVNNSSAFTYTKVLEYSPSKPSALILQVNNADARTLAASEFCAVRKESNE